VFLDFNYREQSRLEWARGLLTEISFPALDAASRSSAEFTLTIRPETTSTKSGSQTAKAGFSQKARKNLLSSNFRLALDGIPTAARRVSQIDAITVRRAITESAVGAVRGPTTAAGSQEVSHVVLTLSGEQATDFEQWFDDFVIKGRNTDADERNGTLDFMDAAFRESLFTLTFKHLGITRIVRDRLESGSAVLVPAKVNLYCEEMTFTPGAGAIGATTGSSSASDGAAASTSAQEKEAVLVGALRILLDRDQRRMASGIACSVFDTQVPASAEAIATRLIATVPPDEVAKEPRKEEGIAIGERWASERATLDELVGVADLKDLAWSAVALPAGHSLIAELRDSGVLPSGELGPIDLQRGPFVEGIVEGALSVSDRLAKADGMTELTSMRLQLMMDRRGKFLETLSNVMKKESETQAAVTKNLK
jgi:hypothetical protein